MPIRFDSVRTLQTGALAALLLCAGAPAALAQNPDTQAQIKRLENEIQTLSRAVFKGEQPPAGFAVGGNDSTVADMQNRMSQMERTIQSLTGRVEEQDNTIRQLRDQLSRGGGGVTAPSYPSASSAIAPPSDIIPGDPAAMGASAPPANGNGIMMAQPTPVPNNGTYSYSPKPTQADNSFTMSDPNAPAPANAPSAGQLGTITTSVDQSGNAVASAAGSPTAEYENAFTMVRNQDYAGAQIAFDAFIKKYPDNSLVPNAMYWLGESYYVRGQFAPAAKTFAEAYQKYPKGAKAPDNLLKLGLSLAGQGKTKDACVALMQLKKQYPAGSAPVLTRGDEEITRLKCNAPQ